MPNQGGRYVNRDGNRELVHRTKPAPAARPKANGNPQPAAAPAKKSTRVKEQNDG